MTSDIVISVVRILTAGHKNIIVYICDKKIQADHVLILKKKKSHLLFVCFFLTVMCIEYERRAGSKIPRASMHECVCVINDTCMWHMLALFTKSFLDLWTSTTATMRLDSLSSRLTCKTSTVCKIQAFIPVMGGLDWWYVSKWGVFTPLTELI